jgi:hypothetical protein
MLLLRLRRALARWRWLYRDLWASAAAIGHTNCLALHQAAVAVLYAGLCR